MIISQNVGVTASGNTAGTIAPEFGYVLAGGNNITLSQSGNTISIVGGAGGGGGAFTAGISGGNTSGNSGTVSNEFVLAGGNNVTLSGSTNAAGMTVTVSAFNQSVQTQNLIDLSLSGNTAGALALISSGTAILAGGNNITLSQNGQSVTISAFNQSVQTQNCVDLSLAGNTAGALALISSGTAILAGGNNITLSQNGQSVTISAFNQSNQTLGIYASSQTMGQSSSSTYDARSLSIVASGEISLGWSNGSLLISAPLTVAQTNQTLGIYGSSQTTGQSSSSTYDARSLSIVGAGIVSIGWSNSSLLISATAAQSNQTDGIYASSQTVGQSSSSTYDARSLTIVGQGIVSLGWSNSSLLISATDAAQTNQTDGIYASSNTTGQSSSSTHDARSLTVVGQGNVSVGWSNSSFLVSGTQSVQTQNLHDVTLAGNTAGALALISSGTMTLAGGNNITLSQAGNAVTISAGAQTNSLWWAIPAGVFGSSAQSLFSGSLSVGFLREAGFVSVTQGNMLVAHSLSTSSNSSYQVTETFGIAFYTRTGSTLSLASSGSQSYTFNITSNVSTNSVSGNRVVTVPITVNITPGDYWLAGLVLSSTSGTNWATLSVVQWSIYPSLSGQLAAAVPAASFQILPGNGVFSSSTTVFPSSVGFSQLTGTNSSDMHVPVCHFNNYTA